MSIIIDPSPDSQVIFYYPGSAGVWESAACEAHRSGDILSGFDRLLTQKNWEKNTIKKIGVILGKGRFTADRVAATLANTLRLALGISVIALSELPVGPEAFESLAKDGSGYISPRYSAPPRINSRRSV